MKLPHELSICLMKFASFPSQKCARICVSCILAAGICFAQSDPGPRGGSAGAGGPYPTLNSNEVGFFTQALVRFLEIDSVTGTEPGTNGGGLGPTFNGNSCAMCHAQPAIGGSSPGLTSPQLSVPNPQVALATEYSATNTVPSFITVNGPVREARFISDGGVHGLYTIQGRADAPGCSLAQPNFQAALAQNNVIFRIPTPVFGLGLVENTPDATLQANLAANPTAKALLGIAGSLNTSGNDGTVTRFGWKAQNKSLLMFAGEAYNVEMGVSNELFPNERSAVPGCVFNPTPEDATNILNPTNNSTVGTASQMSSDIVNFAAFMRLTAPPAPTTASASELNGQKLFSAVGCALCHSPSLTTAASIFTGMGGVTYQPFSDFALHHMGSNLADGITQGQAGPDQFRTAPLWGLGQRLFFLHDGRTSDLQQAILAHGSQGSEAERVVQAFQFVLSKSQKQDLL
ncbi:MAG TPA: di-heme oxidoredictase family protein, partial [Blastocatellia bacterium]